MAAADFSLRIALGAPSPFQAWGGTSPGKTHRLSLHERRIYVMTSWSRELRGHSPARPESSRLASDFCASPYRSHSPLLSATLSRSSPGGSLGSLRPTPQRTSTSWSMFMLGTRTKSAAGVIAYGASSWKSGRRDLNPRPPEPHSGALPDCATSRNTRRLDAETPRRLGKATTTTERRPTSTLRTHTR